MDEEYFFYGEDLYWGRRMKREGFRLGYFPHAQVIHYHGVTYKNGLAEVNTKWLRMLFQYIRKDRGAIRARLARTALGAGWAAAK